VRANKLENQAIELVAIGLGTDVPDALAGRSAIDTVGYGMTCRLADKVFEQASASRDDVGVIELHDCFAANEVRCCRHVKINADYYFFPIANNLFGTWSLRHFGLAPSCRARGQHCKLRSRTISDAHSTDASFWGLSTEESMSLTPAEGSKQKAILLVPPAWRCTFRLPVRPFRKKETKPHLLTWFLFFVSATTEL
jgi:hypothetical protein